MVERIHRQPRQQQKLTVVREAAEPPGSWPPSAPRAARPPGRPVLGVEEHGTVRRRRQQELEGRPPLVVAADSLPVGGAAGEVRRSRAAGAVREGAARRWHHREEGVAAAEAPLDNHLDTPWFGGNQAK